MNRRHNRDRAPGLYDTPTVLVVQRSGILQVSKSHKWETASDQDIQYIISRPNLDQLGKLKFYVLRGQSTLYGNLNVASKAAGGDQATVRH